MDKVSKELGEQLEMAFGDRRFNNPMEGVGELVDTVVDLLRSYAELLPDEESVVQAVSDVFDRFVAPVDFPRVPNWIEPWLKAKAKDIMLDMVRGFYGELKS